LLGSTARRLLHESPRHVLIARSKGPTEAPLVAVVATDDSPESERCIDEFLRLAPRGLSKVYILTVNEVDAGAASMLVRGLPHLKEKAERWIEQGLRKEAEAQCARLEWEGFDAEPLIVEGGDPATAISTACDTVDANLIVLASPPHGFWDRLIKGSVAEDIFADDSRSLLLLRPRAFGGWARSLSPFRRFAQNVRSFPPGGSHRSPGWTLPAHGPAV
jgi:nucleotide-binding universal stress UspA family protein